MAKIRTNAKFKQYTQNQPTFLPLSLDELIAPGHLVRVVDKVGEKMDISSLLNLYLGGGTSSYHPRMLLKVLLYAYSTKIYTGRKIARALSQDIHFMWLSGKSNPDFRTINSFRSSKTDEDATGMRMKNDELLPAYNIMAGCEEQFITGISVHQNTNDGTCLIPHLKSIETQQPQQPKNIIADSIYGTEQNYQHLEDNEIGNYMKFPQYHNEQTKKHKENIFHKDNFHYNPETDSYTCPNNQQLTLQKEYLQENERTGFKSNLKEYACSDCSQCPLYAQCCKSETGGNRSISINLNLERHKQNARENLKSKEGEVLRKKRSIEIESCFGDIKHNMGFRRFHLRGKDKVKTEITIVAMAHNIRKLQIIGQKAAA